MHAVFKNRFAVAFGHSLRIEAALGARGDDDRILHDLGFHQAQDLGTKILPAVRPAQPTARDRAEAQVHAFHFRRIDENFVARSRPRHLRKTCRVELDRNVAAGQTVRGQEIVAAQGGFDAADECVQDAVLIDVPRFGEAALDASRVLPQFARAP